MSYTDKCCGVCDKYIDLWETGKTYTSKYSEESSPELKRFANDKHNVCVSCLEKLPLKGVKLGSLSLSKKMEDPENITKGYEICIDPRTNKSWKCNYRNLDKDELLAMGIKPKFSKSYPRAYEITGENIMHEGLFTEGGIFCYDKRKLRRLLRQLGVVGKIETFIK